MRDDLSATFFRGNLAGAAAEGAINGKAEDITALPTRVGKVRAVIGINFNADSGDTLNVSAIKIQSSSDSVFTTPVDRVTMAPVVITGVTGDSNTDKRGEAVMDYDLLNHMAANPAHKWLRITAAATRSDTTNTTGALGGGFLFSDCADSPNT